MLASKIFIMCPIPSLQFSYIDHKIENPMRIFAKNDYFCSQINNINTKQVMKKVLFTLTLAFLATTWSFAQENDNTNQKLDSLQQVVNKLSSQIDEDAEADMQQKIWKDRAKYFNLSYVIQKLQDKDNDGTQFESDFGVAISRGRTYYLHKKPILKMIKFGIDWTQFDINYLQATMETIAAADLLTATSPSTWMNSTWACTSLTLACTSVFPSPSIRYPI